MSKVPVQCSLQIETFLFTLEKYMELETVAEISTRDSIPQHHQDRPLPMATHSLFFFLGVKQKMPGPQQSTSNWRLISSGWVRSLFLLIDSSFYSMTDWQVIFQGVCSNHFCRNIFPKNSVLSIKRTGSLNYFEGFLPPWTFFSCTKWNFFTTLIFFSCTKWNFFSTLFAYYILFA